VELLYQNLAILTSGEFLHFHQLYLYAQQLSLCVQSHDIYAHFLSDFLSEFKQNVIVFQVHQSHSSRDVGYTNW
jgi:hypothetical protein